MRSTPEKEPGRFIKQGPYDGRVKNIAWRVLVHLCGEQPDAHRATKKPEEAVQRVEGADAQEPNIDEIILDHVVIIECGLRQVAEADTSAARILAREELDQMVGNAVGDVERFRPQLEQPTLPFLEPSVLEPQSADSLSPQSAIDQS